MRGFRFWRTLRERRWRALLSPYVDGALTAGETPRLEAHLAACPACRQELEELRATVALLRALPEVPVPRSFALPAAVPARAAAGRAVRRPPPRLLQFSGAAAVLLFVGLLVADLATLGGGAPPEPLAERAAEAPEPTQELAAEAVTAEAAAGEALDEEALEAEEPTAAPETEEAVPAATPAATEEPVPAEAAPAPAGGEDGRLALRIMEGMAGGLALVLVGGGLYLWRRGTRSPRPPS